METETIKLNDVEYIRKDANKPLEIGSDDIFPIAMQIKMYTVLSKEFQLADEYLEDRKALEEDFVAMDRANVTAIYPVTKRAKLFLKQFNRAKMPTLSFVSKTEEEIRSKFSIEYIDWIIRFLKISTESSLVFKMKNDYPIMIETEDFKVILAPRIETD